MDLPSKRQVVLFFLLLAFYTNTKALAPVIPEDNLDNFLFTYQDAVIIPRTPLYQPRHYVLGVSYSKEQQDIKRIIQREAEKTGIKWQDLWILAKYESTFRTDVINSRGEFSVGLFQINLNAHRNITIEQAKCPVFSTQWTIDKLIRNGYLEGNRTYSLARHQGNHKIPHVMQRARNIVQEADMLQ